MSENKDCTFDSDLAQRGGGGVLHVHQFHTFILSGFSEHYFQNMKTKLKSGMNAGHPTVRQNVQRDRKRKTQT